MKTLIRGTIVGHDSLSDVHVRDGKVAKITKVSTKRPDVGSRKALIAPLLVDIQVNGAFGIDLQSPTLRVEDVLALSERLAAWGVGQWVPTIITNTQKRMVRSCSIIADAMKQKTHGATISGIHLEGPYISPVDGPRGAHVKRHVRGPSLREFDALHEASEGAVLYTTVAPEVPGALAFIRAVVKRGVQVSLGHHNASREVIEKAVDAGARLATHLGNGLASTINRHENPLWPQLADDRLSASLIADLHHLPPEILKTFVRAKGAERVVLTSDAVHLAGMAPGKYDLAGTPVELKRNGKICLTGTDLLAGSSLMLLEGVLNARRHTDLNMGQAFACGSSVPAELLGLRKQPWPPKVGSKANFLVCEAGEGSKTVVVGVWIRGKRVEP